MKLIGTLLALAICSAVHSQQIITASSEPLAMFKNVNDALSVNNTNDAIKEFKKIVCQYTASGRTRELPEQYFGMALMLALNGNYKESVVYHKKAIRAHRRLHHTEPLEMTINLGLTYQLAGKLRKAKKLLGGNHRIS